MVSLMHICVCPCSAMNDELNFLVSVKSDSSVLLLQAIPCCYFLIHSVNSGNVTNIQACAVILNI
jgi:hypothetical protein